MRHLMVAVALAATFTTASVDPILARGSIERACLKADRKAASRQLCGCIQDVAGSVFSRNEQKRVAKFFADPHLTQKLRQSNRRSDERFWDKYKQFGAQARTYCAPATS